MSTLTTGDPAQKPLNEEFAPLSVEQLRSEMGQPPAEPPPQDDGPIKWNGKEFEAAITVGDKTQRFLGATIGAVAAQLVKAQEHASAKIIELTSKRKPVQVDKTIPDYTPINWTKPRELTPAEEMAILEIQQQSPSKAFRMQCQAIFGCNPEELVRGIQTGEAQALAALTQKAANEFIREHKDDFESNQENNSRVDNFLKTQGLPFTRNNFEYAFQELTSQGVKFKAEVKPPEEEDIPIPPPPATLTGRSARAAVIEEPKGGVDDTKAASMPLDQLKALIQQRGRVAGGSGR